MGRRWSSSQRESLRREPTPLTPESQTYSLQPQEKVNVCCLIPQSTVFCSSGPVRLLQEEHHSFIQAGNTFIHNELPISNLQVTLDFGRSKQGHCGSSSFHLHPNFPRSLMSSPAFQGTRFGTANSLWLFNCSPTKYYSWHRKIKAREVRYRSGVLLGCAHVWACVRGPQTFV